MSGWLETFLVGLLGRVVLPAANASWGAIGKRAPRWLRALRWYVRRKQLRLTIDDNGTAILACVEGRQMEYAHVQRMMMGRLEGEALLRAVTSLEAIGLLNKPRLSQPPDPQALLTVTSDAALVLRPQKRPRKVRARRGDVAEAVGRRTRLQDDRTWLQDYDERAREYAYLSPDMMNEECIRRA